jgi:KUP system potassium uptake protein
MVHCILESNILFERNIMASIIRTEHPYELNTQYRQGIGTGLDSFEIHAGYMTVVNVEALLEREDIKEKVIFYGDEDIISRNPVWKAFSMIKRIFPNFVQFYRLPSKKLHGIVTRIEM